MTKGLDAKLILLTANLFGHFQIETLFEIRKFGAWNFPRGLSFRNTTLDELQVHHHTARFGFAREP
jgi:hypothetical protein